MLLTRQTVRRYQQHAHPALFLDTYHSSLFVDPNAPKRGLSAYMFFANEQRENVREENPGISFGKSLRPANRLHRSVAQLTPSSGQVGKILGERWKALDEKARRPYDAKAAADKKRYEDEKAQYLV